MAVGLLLARHEVLLAIIVLYGILLCICLGLPGQLAARSKVAAVLLETKVQEVFMPKEVVLCGVQEALGIWVFGMIPQMLLCALR